MNKALFLIINSSLFAVAMGWLEGIVVVYLRTILARRTDWKTIEITRELATLVIIVTFAITAARNRRERFAVFFWCFAVWDIVYYLSLWTWLRWPESLATMDTLFYIPCVWQAPVYVPILFALIMMLIAFLLWRDRLTDHLALSGRWAMIGWMVGLLAGVINALARDLPATISAMGMSICLGIIAAGLGFGYQVGKNITGWSLVVLLVMAWWGMIGGILGYLACTMFYTSPFSFFWPPIVGFVAGVILYLQQRTAWIPKSIFYQAVANILHLWPEAAGTKEKSDG